MEKNKLGRGLSGILKVNSSAERSAARDENPAVELPPQILISQISASPYQPRQVFDDGKLAELAESLNELGMAQPVVVRRLSADRYQLVAGERRLRAATILGWQTVPAVISNAPEDNLRELALVENLQRENLNAIETAEALKELCEQTSLTHEKIAARLGKSRVWITNSLRLLNLPKEICQLIAEEKLSGAHGRTLLGLTEPLMQLKIAKRIAAEPIPVQQLEKMVQKINGGGRKKRESGEDTGDKSRRESAGKNRHVLDLENRLAERLGAQVKINDLGGAGTIEIPFSSYDEIASILAKLDVET